MNAVDQRIARRLAALRAHHGLSLDQIAERTGISRATLSRIERSELSPTAVMLGALCRQYGWTLSRLMGEAESGPAPLVKAARQVVWKDPATGYIRRVVSPPYPGLKGELVEITLPSGACVSYEASPIPAMEHHLWMLEGSIEIEIEGTKMRAKAGDCARYTLTGPSRYECTSKKPARYVMALVHP